MSRYDCPHCGKFNLRTFCENCGKPTESLWKYRVMYFIGLIAIPSVSWFCYTEINRYLPLAVADGSLDPNFANMFSIVLFPIIAIGCLSVLSIVYQWMNIELAFKEYYKKLC